MDNITGNGSQPQTTTSDQVSTPPQSKRLQLIRPDLRESWKPADLGPYLDGTYEVPTPSVGLHRTDGLHFLYPGKHHEILGETESGKTWFCLIAVLAEI